MSAFDVPITPGCPSAVPRAPAMFGIPIPAGGPWLPEIARTPELLADTAETPAAFCDMAVTPAPLARCHNAEAILRNGTRGFERTNRQRRRYLWRCPTRRRVRN